MTSDCLARELRAWIAGAMWVCSITVVTGCASSGDEGTIEAALVPSPTNAAPGYGDFDGDGCTDIGIKSDAGVWYIDLCANGYDGPWDVDAPGYGDASARPVPADYDGDGKTDLAIKDDDTGRWAIDYAKNGFGGLEEEYFGYGFAGAVPVPADYDGDGRADLSVKDSSGMWGIDLAAINGFGAWDDQRWNYGNASSIPVPANYDGDFGPTGKPIADRAVKTASGEWKIDYSHNGYGNPGACVPPPCSGGIPMWDLELADHSYANGIPIPANYDDDGFADLAIKDDAWWYIDFQRTGYGAWEWQTLVSGSAATRPVVGDFQAPVGDALNLAVQDVGTGESRMVLIGHNSWIHEIDNPGRPTLTHPQAPTIDATRIIGPTGMPAIVDGRYQLGIGHKYTIEVDIGEGSVVYAAGLEINSSLQVPESLVINNRIGATTSVNIDHDHTRRFSIVCTQPGFFPVGFRFRDTGPPIGTSNAFNADPRGIGVDCRGPGWDTISGRVTIRRCLPLGSTDCGDADGGLAHYSVGTESSLTGLGARVEIEGPDGLWLTRTSDVQGYWSATVPNDVPLRITITRNGFSDTIANGVQVPGGPNGGLYLYTPLEEAFTALRNRGMRYTTYLDYTQGFDFQLGIPYWQGRTIFHVVEIDTQVAMLKTRTSPMDVSLVDRAPEFGQQFPVIINGGLYQDQVEVISPALGAPVGYFFSVDDGGDPGSQIPCFGDLVCTADEVPMLAITGTTPGQHVRIEWDTKRHFRLASSSDFYTMPDNQVIWDPPGDYPGDENDHYSDVAYALQCGNQAPLYRADTGALAWEVYPEGSATAVGVNDAAEKAYLVVADGEGIQGANGAGGEQVGRFFRDVLVAEAMLMDSGNSTQMILWGAAGPRRINHMAGEGHNGPEDPYRETYGATAVGTIVTAGVP
jgi:hypothetical protein